MGKVIHSFEKIRQQDIANEKRVIRHSKKSQKTSQEMLELYRETLVHDIALCFILETQRSNLGDRITDRFLDRFCDFRDNYSLNPNDYDGRAILKQFLEEQINCPEGFPLDMGFDKLIIKSNDNRIICNESSFVQVRSDASRAEWLSKSQNTAAGISFFQEWARKHSSVFSRLSDKEAIDNLDEAAQDFAFKFVENYISVTIDSIKYNTLCAQDRVEERTRKYRLQPPLEAPTLRLVKG